MSKIKLLISNFKREFSAGCIVFKPSTIKFLLGKHSGYHKWVLPKGLIEKGEHGFETAIRETEEEMGVKAKLVFDKPIYKEQYIYFADFKTQPQIPNSKFQMTNKMSNVQYQNSKQFNNLTIKTIKTSTDTRRVIQYQEQGGRKTRVFKTVSFYLAEYLEGDPKNHGWEMEEAGWFTYDEALKIMAFKGEKEALEKTAKLIKDLNK